MVNVMALLDIHMVHNVLNVIILLSNILIRRVQLNEEALEQLRIDRKLGKRSIANVAKGNSVYVSFFGIVANDDLEKRTVFQLIGIGIANASFERITNVA